MFSDLQSRIKDQRRRKQLILLFFIRRTTTRNVFRNITRNDKSWFPKTDSERKLNNFVFCSFKRLWEKIYLSNLYGTCPSWMYL